MEINVANLVSDPASSEIIDYLRENEELLAIEDAQLYYDFPLYKDDEGNPIAASVLLVSPNHGVVAFQTSEATNRHNVAQTLSLLDDELGKVFSLLYSRLVRYRLLLLSRTQLKFPVNGVIFTPNIDLERFQIETEFDVCENVQAIGSFLENVRGEPLQDETYKELLSVIEGTKGLIRPKLRPVSASPHTSKGDVANQIEAAILSFDRQQKRSAIVASFDGPQRIRGLAGSGKTAILALKAALTHLRYPDALIVYTFYTRSLYQHIRRLITRFYRQYDDQDPDWTKIRIMHAWGGQTNDGVYYDACVAHNVKPLTFTEARRLSKNAPFDYACQSLLKNVNLKPLYDFIFIDEGQDFPASFIRLSLKIAKQQRVVWAYDDLQTIFQSHAPTPEEVFGTDANGKPLVELNLDTVLYKCYRNPREVLVCAHAVGFGIYGKIVQMLENREHWEDIGYVVKSGDFTEGSKIIIERPIENSLETISQSYRPDEIVKSIVCETFDDEVTSVVNQIQKDLNDGLQPDDILVIVVDDRNASNYLQAIAHELAMKEIGSNNIHIDSVGIRDFSRRGRVTLSTVHKAKGNEAFMVYIVGVDALFSSYAGVRERNMLFTAMTRAKGWVRISGIGSWAKACQDEVEMALKNFPALIFTYPSDEELKIMKRDLTERGARKMKMERLLEQVMRDMDPDEIKRFVEQRALDKKKQ